MKRWLTSGSVTQSEIICITAYGKFFTGVTPIGLSIVGAIAGVLGIGGFAYNLYAAAGNK